jgi:hypothetical protein
MSRPNVDALANALRACEAAGNDIADMAPHFIATGDVTSLRTYGANIASLAHAALASLPPRED